MVQQHSADSSAVRWEQSQWKRLKERFMEKTHLCHTLKGRYEQTKEWRKRALSAGKRPGIGLIYMTSSQSLFPTQSPCLVIKFIHTFSNKAVLNECKGWTFHSSLILLYTGWGKWTRIQHYVIYEWIILVWIVVLGKRFNWQFSSSPVASDTKDSLILMEVEFPNASDSDHSFSCIYKESYKLWRAPGLSWHPSGIKKAFPRHYLLQAGPKHLASLQLCSQQSSWEHFLWLTVSVLNDDV